MVHIKIASFLIYLTVTQIGQAHLRAYTDARMYVYMSVYMYVCMYVRMLAFMYVGLHECMTGDWMHTHTHTHTHIYI